jgi:prepilin-type N-terminal cleavage/methylation domain-containing protein
MTRQSSYERGLTMLEIMVVLAIIAGLFVLVRGGLRMVTKADLVDDSTGLAAMVKRTSQLAIEHSEMHRILIDLDKNAYVVEVCQGSTAIARNEAVTDDPDKKKDAIERGKVRLQTMPADSFGASDPEDAVRRTIALAGSHIADRQCVAVTDQITGESTGKRWGRLLNGSKGIKFKQVYVQHRDDPVTKGQVAVYFWPSGTSEKTDIELTDGDAVFSVLVHGLTGRVELHDGALRDVNDFMLKNVMGDKDAAREDSK